MNASVHSAIGVSPAQLLFGNAIALDRGIMLSKPKASANSSKTDTPTLSEWAENMLQKQAHILRAVWEAHKKHDDYHIVHATTGGHRVSSKFVCLSQIV